MKAITFTIWDKIYACRMRELKEPRASQQQQKNIKTIESTPFGVPSTAMGPPAAQR